MKKLRNLMVRIVDILLQRADTPRIAMLVSREPSNLQALSLGTLIEQGIAKG